MMTEKAAGLGLPGAFKRIRKRLGARRHRNSPANYQKKCERLWYRDEAKRPWGIVRSSRSVSVKRFNINAGEDEVISALYFESRKEQADDNTPVVIYFYGNSLSNSNPVHYLNYCSRLSSMTGGIIIMINCLQPPKFRFPMAHDNAISAIKWVKETCPYWQISSDKVYVSGDALGANLALSAMLSLRNSQKSLNIAGMILTDPLIDATLSSASFREFAVTPTITREDLRASIDEYAQCKSQIFDRRLSMILEKDFTKLPPALIITSEFSPLKDDARALKTKLEECSSSVFLFEQKNAYCSFLFERSKRRKKNAETLIREFIKNNDTNYLRMVEKSMARVI